MDCKKVGQLILKLRNEKGLTQKQVADSLNISNKTVSKWECGMGCPDVTLWTELSEVLGADVLKLLEGELKPNKPDIGKIEKVKFYVCPSCSNILISTGEATISCCGRKLAMLKPAPKHDEHEVTIQEIDMQHFISINHPMTKEHYILFIAYVQNERVLLHRLYPEQNAEINLPMMRSRGNLYIYCTEHGLMKYPFKAKR